MKRINSPSKISDLVNENQETADYFLKAHIIWLVPQNGS